MNNVIIHRKDRDKISIYFTQFSKIQIQLRDDIYEKHKDIYIKNSYFQLICPQRQSEKFTFYRNCKVLEVKNKSLYFKFGDIIEITESELIKIQRKEKLKKLINA